MFWRSEQREIPKSLSPVGFCGAISARFNSVYVAVPTLFIILKQSGLEVLPPKWAEAINYVLGSIYPPSATHYSAIKSASLGEAANYELFLTIIILFHFFLAQYTISESRSGRTILRNPGVGDIFFLLIGFAGIHYVFVDDLISFRHQPIWDFYVDDFGFYLLRQGALMSFVLLYGIVILLFGVRLTDVFHQRRSATKRPLP
ncbi:MAG: hypothetical protein QOF19_107 [Alphaproteobacteria bacterium]|jgi:hypothetical protein|nr:hypothetical protein [Alphaproteobacteria bacterium]